MDPIHPITPRPPAIAQIVPSHSDRTTRERRRREREQSKRRPPPSRIQPDSQGPEDDEEPRHIDVRA
jgi:hypothetical protein